MLTKPPFFEEKDVERLAARFWFSTREIIQNDHPTVTIDDFESLAPRWREFRMTLARQAAFPPNE